MTSPLLTKAAQDAAREIHRHDCLDNYKAIASTAIILRHLAPVQSELDRLKKEMNEAREFVKTYRKTHTYECNIIRPCLYCKIEAWLERNK
jgi:hypothetical protein